MAVSIKDPQTTTNDTSFGDLSWSNTDNVKTSNNAYATVSLVPTQLWSNIYTYTTNATHASVTNWVGGAISTKPTLPNTIENKIASVGNTTYNGKTALTYVHIQSNAVFPNQMVNFFNGCSNLTGVSQIPNSVTNMSSTFHSCSSLVNVPVIPNSVTNMHTTFYSCSSLINAPVISNSVTNMSYTFRKCSNLVNAPTIGANVVAMYRTFYNCTNLIGDITLVNANVTNLTQCFYGTNASKPKTLYVPTGSATYNLAMAQCDGKNGVTVVPY